MSAVFENPVTQKLADFIASIGLEIHASPIDATTFLPGILVKSGGLLVDETKLKYPGDLLHEAGHLAVSPGDLRPSLSGEVVLPGVLMEPIEAQAMAWSYAAILHLGLDPRIVFHEGGYLSKSEALLLNFTMGVYIGVSGLQDAGLTVVGQRAKELDVPPYPHMLKWLRD